MSALDRFDSSDFASLIDIFRQNLLSALGRRPLLKNTTLDWFHSMLDESEPKYRTVSRFYMAVMGPEYYK